MSALRSVRVLMWAAGLALPLAVQLAGQERGALLRGTLVTEGDDTPVTLARVELLDERGVTIAERLSDQGGAFSFRIAAPGVYRARVSRIGYESWVSDTLHFATLPESRTLRIDVPVRPVPLSELLALAESVCPAPADELRRAAALYESVRPALASVGSTADLGALRMQVVRPTIIWRRGARNHGYDTTTVVVARAYHNASPSPLETYGYAEMVDTLPTFYAPDGDAMASPGFLPTHCLSIVEGDDDGTTGLAFEPKPGRDLAEGVEPVGVRGVLWVDTLSMGPTTLEFEYTSLRPFLRRHLVPGLREHVQAPRRNRVQFSPVRIRDGIGGTFEFERIAPARWMIRRWRIGSPGLLPRGWFGVGGSSVEPVAGPRWSSGEVLEIIPTRQRGTLVLTESRREVLPAGVIVQGGALAPRGDGGVVWSRDSVWIMAPGEPGIHPACPDLVRAPVQAGFGRSEANRPSVEIVDRGGDGEGPRLVRFVNGECGHEDWSGPVPGTSEDDSDDWVSASEKGTVVSARRFPFAWSLREDAESGGAAAGRVPTADAGLYEEGAWLGAGVFALDAGFLQVLADLESDRRHLILYDAAGARVRRYEMDVPFGILATAPSSRRLLAVRRTDRVELVTYRWAWEVSR